MSLTVLIQSCSLSKVIWHQLFAVCFTLDWYRSIIEVKPSYLIKHSITNCDRNQVQIKHWINQHKCHCDSMFYVWLFSVCQDMGWDMEIWGGHLTLTSHWSLITCLIAFNNIPSFHLTMSTHMYLSHIIYLISNEFKWQILNTMRP